METKGKSPGGPHSQSATSGFCPASATQRVSAIGHHGRSPMDYGTETPRSPSNGETMPFTHGANAPSLVYLRYEFRETSRAGVLRPLCAHAIWRNLTGKRHSGFLPSDCTGNLRRGHLPEPSVASSLAAVRDGGRTPTSPSSL